LYLSSVLKNFVVTRFARKLLVAMAGWRSEIYGLFSAKPESRN